MRLDLDGLDRRGEGPGPFRTTDARLKVAIAFGYVILVVATPVGAWPAFGVEAAALATVVALARLPIRLVLGRWLGFVAVVAFLAALVAQGHPTRPRIGFAGVWLALLGRNSLAFVALLTLVETTPWRGILVALGRLGVPAVLVSTLHFMMRYLHVLADELARMAQARRARSFRRSGRLDAGLLTGLIGTLMIRSLERGERVHAAMLARGWDGTIRGLDSGPAGR